MNNFKEIAEKCLKGELSGTFILRNGSRVHSSLLSRIDSKLVPYELHVHSYYPNGRYLSSNISDLDIINFISDMEERNVKLTLEKAKEWYEKGGELKEVALQAFKEEELKKLKFTDITNLKVACEVLGYDYNKIDASLDKLIEVNPIYYYQEKLSIIIKACNKLEGYDSDWNIGTQRVYYPIFVLSEERKNMNWIEWKYKFTINNKILYCGAYSGNIDAHCGPGYMFASYGLSYSYDYMNRLNLACATSEIAKFITKTYLYSLVSATFGHSEHLEYI